MAKARFDNVRRPQREIMDWNAVGQSVVKELDEARAFREQEKAKIEELTLKAGDIISKPELGEFEPANQFALTHANNASEMALIANRLLKQGSISPTEYKKRMQNLIDGTSQIFDVSKKYQETYNDYLERAKNGESQELEVYMREQLGKFANLKDVNTFVNPNSYAISAGLLEDFDGVRGLADRPSAHLTIAQLGAINEQKYDKLDLSKELMPEVNSIGEYIKQEIGTDKSVKEISDPKLKDKFDKIESSVVDSILTNPYNQSSILTNTLVRNPDTNNRYKIAQEIPEGENREDYLLLKIDGSGRPVFEFTEKQNEQASEMVKAKFRSMIDQKRKIVRNAPSPTSSEIRERETRDAEANRVKNWRDLAIGDVNTKNAAINSILGSEYAKKGGLLRIKVEEDGSSVRLEYNNPAKNREIDLSRDLSFGDYMRLGSEVTGVEDPDKAIRMSGIGADQFSFNRDFGGGITVERAGQPEDPITTYNRYIRNFDEEELSRIFKMSEKDAVVELNEILKGTGFTAETKSNLFGTTIKIKDAEGKTLATFDSESDMDDDEISSNITELKNKLISLTPEGSKIDFVKLIGTKPQERKKEGELD